MSTDLKLINMADVPTPTSEEYAEIISRQKAEYQAELDALGASDAMKEKARSISCRQDSCERCVHCDSESVFCHIPYSDAKMEDLDIDPCYDGVLRYLVHHKGKKRRRKA